MLRPEWSSSANKSRRSTPESSFIRCTLRRTRNRTAEPALYVVHRLADPRDSLTDAPQYGNVNEQIDFVAEQIANITELKDGFDAIGFSQGGQFLRAYVERYNTPPVHNLVTFGSQHMGMWFVGAWI